MGGSVETVILETLPEHMGSLEERGYVGLAEEEELWGEPPLFIRKAPVCTVCVCVYTCVKICSHLC